MQIGLDAQILENLQQGGAFLLETESIDLAKKHESDRIQEIFARSNTDRNMMFSIDSDGLPYVGQIVHPGEPVYSTHNTLTSTTKPTHLKRSEDAIIDYVSVDGTGSKNYLQKVNICTRRTRYPIIGDKFSSRHGQKGVCSQLWPDIDMPFSAVTGMRPDLIINPHAFPSRMTIGMLLESIAAQGGSLHGKFIDATPFPRSNCNEEDEAKKSKSGSVVDELGAMLTAYGFNHHGVEVLHSGVYGTELAVF
ncbi:DNA-directed RNA polymerase I subunit 2-like [Curcuma longa]|uniref:DNA-directed RNA polymerase I subunit 2-like n=1 Tax=Curcuma longa TaxID=136217 RepID=UPI003D9F9C65